MFSCFFLIKRPFHGQTNADEGTIATIVSELCYFRPQTKNDSNRILKYVSYLWPECKNARQCGGSEVCVWRRVVSRLPSVD